MTEKEAWLEVAEMFDSAEETWKYASIPQGVAGICDALLPLCFDRGKISMKEKEKMKNRLGVYFNPNAKDVTFDFFWPNDCTRTSRTLRATACCFLAAMCDD